MNPRPQGVPILSVICLVLICGCSGGTFQTWDVSLDQPAGDAIDASGDSATDVPVDLPEDCADSDSDGVCDEVDACEGHDDALDEDGDTVPDGCDICPGGDDRVDTDGDTVPDACDCEGLSCGANAHCEDTGGGPECVCDDGYEGDGTTCTDIDECALGTQRCDENATCSFTRPGM